MNCHNPQLQRRIFWPEIPALRLWAQRMQEPLDVWFKREILQHEAALLRLLARIWPRKHEIQDLRQETYARVYAAAMTSRPASPRSFLFTTAHHLIVDRVRRERVVSIEAAVAAMHVAGSFHANNVEAFVRLLERGYPLRAEERGEEFILTARQRAAQLQWVVEATRDFRILRVLSVQQNTTRGSSGEPRCRRPS